MGIVVILSENNSINFPLYYFQTKLLTFHYFILKHQNKIILFHSANFFYIHFHYLNTFISIQFISIFLWFTYFILLWTFKQNVWVVFIILFFKKHLLYVISLIVLFFNVVMITHFLWTPMLFFCFCFCIFFFVFCFFVFCVFIDRTKFSYKIGCSIWL